MEFRAESYMEPHSRYLVAGEAAIADSRVWSVLTRLGRLHALRFRPDLPPAFAPDKERWIAEYALGTHLDAVSVGERAAESFGAVRHPRPSNLSASTRS